MPGVCGDPPTLWHPVLAILGRVVLVCMHVALGVRHPNLVG